MTRLTFSIGGSIVVIGILAWGIIQWHNGPKHPKGNPVASRTEASPSLLTGASRQSDSQTAPNVASYDLEIDALTPPEQVAMHLFNKDTIEAARILVGMSGERIAAILGESYNSSDPGQRQFVIKLATLLGDESLKPFLRKALIDKDEQVRCAALRAWMCNYMTDQGLDKDIGRMLSDDPSDEVRGVAAQYFTVHPESVEAAAGALEKALSGSDPVTVWRSAFSLSILSPAKMSDAVKEAMSALYSRHQASADPEWRACAAVAASYLLNSGQQQYRGAVLRFLDQTEARYKIRAGAVLGLKSQPDDPELVAAVARAAGDPENDSDVYIAICHLGVGGMPPKVVDACRDALRTIPSAPGYFMSRIYVASALAAAGHKEEGLAAMTEIMQTSAAARITPGLRRIVNTEMCRTAGKRVPLDLAELLR